MIQTQISMTHEREYNKDQNLVAVNKYLKNVQERNDELSVEVHQMDKRIERSIEVENFMYKHRVMSQRVTEMLQSTPVGVTDEVMLMWQRMKPMSVELFQKYWDRVEPNASLFDIQNAEYQHWQDDGWRYFGMRHKVTG